MANLPPKNFIAYHYAVALPQFITDRISKVVNSHKLFNVTGLLTNFFSPYKRLEVGTKGEKFGAKTLIDKLSFNLTSILVGICVRLALLLSWSTATIVLTLLTVIIIPIYAAIPLLSYPKFQKIINENFFESDISNTNQFLKKLYKTQLFAWLHIFLGDTFSRLFSQLPKPNTIGIASAQNQFQMISTIYKNWPTLKEFLESENIKEKDFTLLVNYLASHIDAPKPKANLSIGGSLSFGYTNNLDKYSTQIISSRLPTESKKQLILEIEKILVRPSSNNVMLVGEPGVGRHNTIEELSATISRNQLPTLFGHKVLLLDTVALAATGKNLIETKQAIEQVFKEGKSAGNVILVIDHIDKIASSQDGRIDITEVLTTVLNDNSMPIVGISTPDDYNAYIRPNGTFVSLFERINLPEANQEETVSILIGNSMEVYEKEKVQITLGAILEIASKSTRLTLDKKQPGKSQLLLTDVIAQAKTQRTTIVDVALVDSLISAKTKTPVGQITKGESEKLKDLEKVLHSRVIGQDEAIIEIAKAMRRARAELTKSKRPIGSFLFLGPTGVGKTETAKALAQTYFGSEEKMVRFDMTEFTGSDALSRVIGNPQTKTQGQLATKIRENPYTLLLLDEFEKANKDVHNLFLQIIDEGNLTDAFGKKVSFDNVIIIATSNAGAEFIREQLSQGPSLSTKQGRSLSEIVIEYVLKQGLFTPELINRFDGAVVYKPLTQEEIVAVSMLLLQQLAKDLKQSKNITLEITQELAAKVAQQGFDPQFGARPIRRLIQDKIEDGIAKLIIDGTAKSGSKINSTQLLGFL